MVQGLAFLSKKSWHTKNLANQEKVWIAEERKKAEQAKTTELARQIQQEREQEELDKIAGKRNNKLDRGIDWMYHGQEKHSEIATEDAQKKSEEYLLGKEYVPPNAKIIGDLQVDNTNDGVNAVVAAAASKSAEQAIEHGQQEQQQWQEPSVAQRNEAFRLKLEDPMYTVSREQVHKEKEMEKKKHLYEKALGVKLVESNKSEKKRDKKKKKKRDKKKKRKRRHRDDYDSYSDESDSGSSYDSRDRKRRRRHRHRRDDDRRKERERSLSPEDDRYAGRREGKDQYDDRRSRDDDGGRKRRDGSDDRKRRHRSSSSDYCDDDSYHRYRHSSHKERSSRYSPSPDRRNSRLRSLSHDDDDDDRKPRARRIHDGRGSKEDNRHGGRQYSPSPRDIQDNRKAPPSPSRNDRKYASHSSDAKYGLQGESKLRGHVDLGPDAALLQKRRQAKEEERRRNQQMSSSSSRRRYESKEEREAALRAMQQDADKRTVSSSERGVIYKSADTDDNREHPLDQPNFIHKVTRDVHKNTSLSDRLQQNRNSNQRSYDNTFL